MKSTCAEIGDAQRDLHQPTLPGPNEIEMRGSDPPTKSKSVNQSPWNEHKTVLLSELKLVCIIVIDKWDKCTLHVSFSGLNPSCRLPPPL